MEHQYVVRHSFTATQPWAPVRTFNPGEMVWWDEDAPLILFASTGLQWQPEDSVQFTQSIERAARPTA